MTGKLKTYKNPQKGFGTAKITKQYEDFSIWVDI